MQCRRHHRPGLPPATSEQRHAVRMTSRPTSGDHEGDIAAPISTQSGVTRAHHCWCLACPSRASRKTAVIFRSFLGLWPLLEGPLPAYMSSVWWRSASAHCRATRHAPSRTTLQRPSRNWLVLATEPKEVGISANRASAFKACRCVALLARNSQDGAANCPR